MKILVVSEGRHELQTAGVQGALEILLGKLIGSYTCDKRMVSDRTLPRVRGIGRGTFKRAMEWIYFAQRNQYDAIVLVVDQDNDPTRRIGLDQVQENQKQSIRRAMGIAIRTFDAWMLADEVAVSQVVGRTIPRQPDPESTKDPKSVCHGFCGAEMALGAMYSKIAEHLDLKTLESRCPAGFKPFADRVRKLKVHS